MKGLLKFAMMAFAFAGTAFAQTPAPKASTPAQEAQSKYDLYIFVTSGDGQSGVASKLAGQLLAKIKTVESVNVRETQADAASATAVEFHFLTVETSDTTGALAVSVVYHVKGFDDKVYIGSIIVPVAANTVDDLTEGLYSALGRVFAQVIADPPTVSTTPAPAAAPSSAPKTPVVPNNKLSGSARS